MYTFDFGISHGYIAPMLEYHDVIIMFSCQCVLTWSANGLINNVATHDCVGFSHTAHGFLRLNPAPIVRRIPLR
jgi:hypothetical protein